MCSVWEKNADKARCCKASANDNVPMEGTKEWNDLLYHDRDGDYQPPQKKQKIQDQNFSQEPEVIDLDSADPATNDTNTKEDNFEAYNEYYDLNTGYKIPAIQFGTYKLKGIDCYNACISALQIGYRGFDTASIYDNEELVGEAIKQFTNREELFIQTKLWRSYQGADPKSGKPKCDAELKKSLRKLGTTKN